MKAIKWFAAFVAFAMITACGKDNPGKGGGNGGNEGGPVEQELLYDEVDVSVYKYPGEDDTVNPNLIIPDYGKMTLVAIDTLERTATLSFSGEVPEFYKGSIIVPVKDDNAYPMFVLSAAVSGKTVSLNWRPAQIGEMFFNTSFGSADAMFGPAATKAGNEEKSKIKTALGALKHFDLGFSFDFKGVQIDFDTDVDVVIDKPSWENGFSINSPLKKMKAIFTGTATTGAVIGLEVKGSAKGEYKKPLKSSIYTKRVIFMVSGVPVPVTFDIDLMAQLGIEVKGSVKHSRDYTYQATVKVGGTMDFTTGQFTPVNSFNSKLTKGDPVMEWEGEVHGSVVGSIYPRIKTYISEFKWMGIQTDFKPIVGQIDLHGKYKAGKFLHGYELSLRSELCLNAYYQEFFDESKIHYLLKNDIEGKFEWTRLKQPSSFFKKEPEKKYRGGFNTTTSFNIQVQSEEDGEKCTPYTENEPFWIEAEPQSTVPDPSQASSGVTSRAAAAAGWYIYPLEFTESDDNGNVEVPLTMDGPTACGFKYNIRLRDGNEEILEECPIEFETAVKEYKITNSISGDGTTIYPVCTVKDYGGYVQEVTNLPEGVVTTVTWDHGSFSRTVYVPSYGNTSVNPAAFTGNGTWLARMTRAGTGVGDMCNQVEAYDYGWWAYEHGLGNSLEGAHFSKQDYHGLPCTRLTGSEIGTIIYFENILLSWNTGSGEIRTTSLEGVDGWSYQ